MKRSDPASLPRKLLCLVLCLLLACSVSSAAFAAEDGEINTADETEEGEIPPEEDPGPVAPVVVTAPYIDGDGTGAFLPGENVTRGSFLKMLVAALGEGFDPEESYGSTPFFDVPLNRWYEKYLSFAWLNGLVSGYPDGSFRPDSTITRAEACAMAVRFLELKDADLEEAPVSGFPDVGPDCWAREQIDQLAALGVIHGDGAGNFLPEENLSRAAAVTIVSQLAGFSPNAEQQATLREQFPTAPFRDADVAEWYYPYLLRAVGYVETPPELPIPDEEEEPPAEEEPIENEPAEEQPTEEQPLEAE